MNNIQQIKQKVNKIVEKNFFMWIMIEKSVENLKIYIKLHKLD